MSVAQVKGFVMAFPIFGLASAVLTAVGGYGLYWYHNLSKPEQEEADRLAANYAVQLYNKSLDELTSMQLKRVHDLVQGHFKS